MNSKEETVRPMEDPDMEWAKLETMHWDLLSSKEELEDKYFNFLLEEFLKGGFLYIDKYKDNDCCDENEALKVAKERMRLYIKEQLSFLIERKKELESRIRTKDLLKHLS